VVKQSCVKLAKVVGATASHGFLVFTLELRRHISIAIEINKFFYTTNTYSSNDFELLQTGLITISKDVDNSADIRPTKVITSQLSYIK